MIEIVLAHQIARVLSHDVGPKSAYAVSPQQLATCLESRKAWVSVRCAEEELRYDARKQNLLITFDDGFRDNLTNGLPVLEEHGVSAIIFIATGFIDGEVYPYELELAEVVSNREVLSLPGRDEAVQLGMREDRGSRYRQIRMPLKWVSHAEREDFMKQLAVLNGYDRKDMQTEQFLSWEEVKKLDRHPLITIGAHTRRHVVLTKRSLRDAYREIVASKNRLEDVLGHPVHYFSYPYGASNFFVRQMVRWRGFRYAFTTRAARMQRLTFHNRMSIPRVDLSKRCIGHE